MSRSSGTVDSALLWFHSFLKDRPISGVFGPTRSPCVHLSYGLPQDSVIVPSVYLVYLGSIAGILGPLDVSSTNMLMTRYLGVILDPVLSLSLSRPIVLQSILASMARLPRQMYWVLSWFGQRRLADNHRSSAAEASRIHSTIAEAVTAGPSR